MSIIKPVRFHVHNPGEPANQHASYHESCLSLDGRKHALYWAIQNASAYGGRVVEERSDGTAKVIRDYTRFSPREGERLSEGSPQSTEDSV